MDTEISGSSVTARVNLVFARLLWAMLPTAAFPSVASATPGVPLAPVTVYFENFENRPNPAVVQNLLNYVGAAAALNQTYTADPFWVSGADCNGSVISQASAATYTACGSDYAEYELGNLAYVMGQYHGLSAANAPNESVLAAFTNQGDGGNNLVEFQTGNITLPSATNRFLSFGVDTVQTSCPQDGYGATNPAQYNFYLVSPSATTLLNSAPINACDSPTVYNIPANVPPADADQYRVSSILANTPVLFTGGTSFQLVLRNLIGAGNGNDGAIDNAILVDMTPQLDKVFNPSEVATGSSTQLTFTVTNTTDLYVKSGWSFTDNLPSGMTVVTPAPTTTCPNTSVDISVAGKITVTGSLSANMVYCTVTAQVAAPGRGKYTNDGSNINPASGINPPTTGTTVLFKSADISIGKSDNTAQYLVGQPASYNLTVSNAGPDGATNALVTDPAVNGFSASGVTCTASGGAACPAAANLTVAALQGGGIAIPSLPNGGQVVLAVAGTWTSGFNGNLTNVATLTPGSDVLNTGTSCTSSGATFVAATGVCTATDVDTPAPADMSATGAVTQTVTANTPVSVRTICANAGPNAAAQATCTVSGVPAGFSPMTTCSPPVPVASLAAPGSITCTTTFKPTMAGVITLTTTAGSATPDSNSANNVATSLVNVGAITANPDSSTTAQNTPVTTAVTTNDTSTGAPLNPSSVTPTQPSHGTVVCNNPTPGSCLYTPATNYAGPDSYTYQVCDTTMPTPVCATTTVSLTVQPNLVTANPDTANTPQNTPVTTSVIGNDTVNPSGAPLDPTSVTPTQPAHGTVTCTATGNCTYTPNPNYSGPDQYTYQVCDTSTPTLVCSSTTVQVTVGPDTVTPNPDTGTTPYSTPITTNVVSNDTTSGAPLNPASVTVTTPPAQGSVLCNNPTAGSCVYTPPAGFSGQAVYTYQVCDTTTPTPVCASTTVTIQVGPQANNDTNTTPENTAVNGTVATNDVSPSGSVFTQTSTPAHGTIVFNPDGTYTYTPDTNYVGPDAFTYSVCEPAPNQHLCSTATVNLTVNGTTPVANPDTAVTPFNTPVTTNVIGNDTTSGAPLNPASVVPTQPAHGTVACDTSGHCTYTPTSGYSGPDQYTYTVCDTSMPKPLCATTTVNVQVGPNAVNDTASTAQNTPVNGNVSSNDTYPPGSTFTGTAPPSHGTVTVNADGTYTYTPAAGFSGTDTFTYTVCEAAPNQTLCSTATVTVTVGANVPVANPDTAITPQNTAVTTNVIGNDSSGGAPLNPASVTPTVPPTHGTVTCAAGSCTYTPATNYSGPDQYTYQVCDTSTPTPVCVSAVVTVNVQPNAVTANPDTATTPPNTPVSTPVTGNDTVLPNGAPLNPASVTATALPAHGTVTCAAGSCTYTPATNYSGPDQYSYQVCDTSIPTPVCATTTVTINVGTSTLVANPDTATTPFNTPVTTNVALNDTSTGAPLNPSSVSPFTQPAHGTVTCSAGGCTYTPTAGYSGTDSYTYQICDTATPTPNCAVSTVSVVVGPHASNDTNTATPGSPTQGTVTGNDTYPPGSTFTLVTNPLHGSLTFHPDGSYTYTPDAGFTGTDTFTYAVCLASPNQALCSTATVSITVAGTPTVAVQTPVNTPWLLWLMMLALGAVGAARQRTWRQKM